MSLEMREERERCEFALPQAGPAFVCRYGCAFCTGCMVGMDHGCPNCSRDLVRRPRRKKEDS